MYVELKPKQTKFIQHLVDVGICKNAPEAVNAIIKEYENRLKVRYEEFKTGSTR